VESGKTPCLLTLELLLFFSGGGVFLLLFYIAFSGFAFTRGLYGCTELMP